MGATISADVRLLQSTLRGIGKIHRKVRMRMPTLHVTFGDGCRECGEVWPCMTERLLSRVRVERSGVLS